MRTPDAKDIRAVTAVLATVVLLSLAGCGYGSRAKEREAHRPLVVAGSGKPLSAPTVRIGYFANLTHATAVLGVREGLFAGELGGTRIRTQLFNAGPSEIEALNAEAVDIGFIGPSPAVNGYTKSHGKALRIISGAASGGVFLVVHPEKVERAGGGLAGKRIASPQVGNTQDVALLSYLKEQGFTVDPRSGRGEVSVVRADGKEIPRLFEQGSVDGAWVPEPTASLLVAKGGKRLLEERKLWPDGAFATTNVIVSQRFLAAHPDVVEAVLRGVIRTNEWIGAHPQDAATRLNGALAELTGKPLPTEVLDAAFRGVRFVHDPLPATLRAQAEHAEAAGLLSDGDLRGIYDLRPLNRALRAVGRPEVDEGAAELGVGR
ncbi:ABC transporter substrate-binding protein [Streptomyces rimosus]|uniref:ABC transporter substrate-binding protein n=1 Tax=Streptomyces rimosus TaxID=1927 RepID=UPI0004C6702E|nr:ABC transporter substrate-binding protein [Streptomyces rimosus]